MTTTGRLGRANFGNASNAESAWGSDLDERRKTTRKRSFLKGTVYYNHRHSSIECTIRDFSEYGARLQFASPVTLPDPVELEIPTRDQTLQANVRWRKDDEVGVSFDQSESENPTELAGSGDLSQRVASLEREMTKMHKLIMDLRTDMRQIRGDD
jgi:PilZ domain